MATEEQEEGTELHGTGLGEKMKGGVKRAAGAIGRAARSVVGQPEAGTDMMYQALHADHEQVATLFAKMLSTDDEQKCRQLWQMICVNLTAHARAEQEVIYARLAEDEETQEQVGHSYEEHADIERLIAECDAQGVGSDEFFAMATQLQQVVQHHVDDEEGELLPKARKVLSEDECDQLTLQFQQLKMDLVPEIRQEFGANRKQGSQRSRSSSQGNRRSQSQGADRRRSAQRGGQQKSQSSRGDGRQQDLSSKTLTELREMASRKDIPGRSKMDKRELVVALRRA